MRWNPFAGDKRRIFFRRRNRPLAPWTTTVSIALIVAVLWIGLYYFWLPDVAYLSRENPRTTAYMQIYVRRTLARGKKPIVMMRWTSLDEISPYLRHAVLIEEDAAFFHHGGVDWRALKNALKYNIKKRKWSRGGSTITQQVARNLFLSPARSKWRKILEMLIAFKLERTLSKSRILEIYLNIAEWGMGIYGAQAASEIYFGKPVKDLTLDEAIALATALPSPWRLNPTKDPGPLITRKREVILSRMRLAGYIPLDVEETDIDVPETVELPE